MPPRTRRASRVRGLLGAVPLLLAVLAAAVVPAPEPASAAEGSTASSVLARLVVAPAHRGGYSAAAYGRWSAVGVACRTDARVLVARSSRPTAPTGCAPRSGRWRSAFTGRALTSTRTARVARAVPLAAAWRSGAGTWTPRRRHAFANDTAYARALLVVDAASAQRRGSRGPTGWMPVSARRCAYSKAWIGVKARWRLTVTPEERRVLQADLRRFCASSPALAVPPRPDVAALTARARPTPAPAVPAPPVAPSPTTAPASCPSDAPSGRDLRALLAATPAGAALEPGPGVAEIADFGADLLGLDVPAAVRGVRGAREGSTVLRMTRCTSTRAAAVPTAAGTTNQLSLLRVSGRPVVSDLLLEGTEQGHLYNGLRLSRTSGAVVQRVTVRGVPGHGDVNPRETFGVNDYRTAGTRYARLVVDGAGVGASGLGFNSSSGATLSRCTFTRNRWSAGVAVWQSRDIAFDRAVFDRNRTGLNLERASGAVTLTAPTFSGNGTDLRLASDRPAVASVVISDPVITAPDGRLHVAVAPTYRGVPNTQQRSDLVVLRDGVDVTAQVVAWR